MPIVKAGRSTGLLSKDGNPYTDYSAVAGVPASELRDCYMRLINNKQPVVVGEIIDQRRRRLVLSATAQVPRVVLGARAPAFRPQHGDIIRHAAPRTTRGT